MTCSQISQTFLNNYKRVNIRKKYIYILVKPIIGQPPTMMGYLQLCFYVLQSEDYLCQKAQIKLDN